MLGAFFDDDSAVDVGGGLMVGDGADKGVGGGVLGLMDNGEVDI